MEWKEYILDDICNISIGRTPPRNEHEWFNQTTPSYKWVSIKDMGECGKYISKTSETISMVGQERFRIPIVSPHTILLSFKLTVGRIAITGNDPMLTNEAIAQLPIKDENVVNQDYLYYYLKIFNYGLLGNTSSIANAVNSKTIRKIHIPLPSLETQRRIAAILSSLDDKIENNNRINANLEAQAQALFKSWFVDFEPFGGVMPDDWKEGALEELCTPLKEKVGNRDDVKVLSPVTTGELMLSEEYFTKQVFSQSIAKYIIVPPTAFAYNPARVNIGSLGMNEFDFDGCVSPVYVVFECKDGYEYFFNLFRRTNQFKEEVKSRAIGGVRQTLGYEDFKRIQTIIPPIEVVREFNGIYLSILDVINAYSRENQRLAALRDTLLPKLMKGEITL